MHTKRWVIAFLIFVIVVIAGYATFTYLKERPPAFLIELLTKMSPPPPPLPQGENAPLTAPEGFSATIFARDIPGARVMAFDPIGTMLVSQTSEGNVVALPDNNTDGSSDETKVLLNGLTQPHGILVICADGVSGCTLYVAETGALKSYSYDPGTMKATYRETLQTFPSGDGHFTRTLHPHPDGTHLLISVGSSCNVCTEANPQRATIQSLNLATNQITTLARGVRNTVFMATDPVTGEIWGTDHGRDLIGDDIPPDEVNILTGPTTGVGNPPNFGWPICYGNNVHDTDFDKRQYFRDPCADSVPPWIPLQAHSAALGLAFVPEEGWPSDMGNDLLVAYHGSWNRSTPTGYRVVRFDLGNDRKAVGGPIDFLTGFLAPGAKTDTAIGRPVGVVALPGGVAYISDDRAGAIYRIQWNGNQ